MAVCFECGAVAEEYHHVIPKSLGGKLTIPLCSVCHGKVHDIPDRGGHRELCRRGQDKLMAEDLCAVWWHVCVEGMGIGKASDFLGLSKARVKKRVERITEMSDEWRETLFEPIVGDLLVHDFSLNGGDFARYLINLNSNG